MIVPCVRHVIPGSLGRSHSGRMNVVLFAMVDVPDKEAGPWEEMKAKVYICNIQGLVTHPPHGAK
jgi:hypothetical protein